MIREKRLTGLRHQSPLTNSRSRENLFIEFPWRDWIPYFFRVALAAVEFFLEMLSTFLPPVPSTIATLNAPWRTLLLIEEDRSRDQSSRSGRWIHHATSVNWKGLASPMLWVETAFFFRFSLSGPCPGRTVELYGPIWGARSLRSRRVCYFGNSLEKSGDAAGGIYSPVLEMRELVCKFYHRAKLRDCRITDVIYVYAHTHTHNMFPRAPCRVKVLFSASFMSASRMFCSNISLLLSLSLLICCCQWNISRGAHRLR